MVDPQRPAVPVHLAGGAAGNRHRHSRETIATLIGTADGGYAQLRSILIGQQQGQHVSVDQQTAALGDRRQDWFQLGLPADRAGDLGGGLQGPIGPLQAVALDLEVAVELGVVDRGRHPLGQDHHALLVGLGEFARVLLGQV